MDAFLSSMDQLNRRTIRCAPFPSKWEKFSQKHKLSWSRIAFTVSNKNSVPEEKGIYCFLVRNDFDSVPPIGYPLYVGIVGVSANESSLRSLRNRYKEYLREFDDPKGRRHVRFFLNVFKDELTFMYAPTSVKPSELKKMEKALNDALLPPFSRKDFSAEILAQRNAWQ